MSEENKTEFMVSDKVSWGGVVGHVISIDRNYPLPLVVTFKEMPYTQYHFHLDGRSHDFHKESALKLISRPKKKIKIEAWANVYEGGAQLYFDTKTKADEYENCFCDANRIACVKLVSEEEVEL